MKVNSDEDLRWRTDLQMVDREEEGL
jgi:hypothetical protein